MAVLSNRIPGIVPRDLLSANHMEALHFGAHFRYLCYRLLGVKLTTNYLIYNYIVTHIALKSWVSATVADGAWLLCNMNYGCDVNNKGSSVRLCPDGESWLIIYNSANLPRLLVVHAVHDNKIHHFEHYILIIYTTYGRYYIIKIW